MLPEEFRALLNRIVENRDNQALVTELATQAADTYSERHTAFSTLEESHTKTAAQIKELQETNMRLYLKQGVAPAPQEPQTPETLSYENLLENWEAKQ